MINVDISNLWTCVTLPQLLGTEQEIFDAHNRLRDNQPEGPDFMAWLGQPDSVTGRLIHSIRRRADQIKDTSRVLVVCGTGSIWRGAKAAVELWGGADETSILFVGDTVSSRQWIKLTQLLENKDMSLLIISDDGLALGPNLASRGLRWLMERKYGQNAKERICVATTVGSCLHHMAQEEGYELFPLPKQAGGTGSALTAAALVPMAVAGMDPVDVLEGAVEAYNSMDIRSFENPAWLYAAARHVLKSKGRSRELMCCTDKSFNSFCRWWQYHAWRHGDGVSPDAVLLPEGMRVLDTLAQNDPSVFETVLWLEPNTRKIPVEMDWKDYDGLGFLSGRTLDETETALREAMVLQHNDLGVPIVEIQCGELTGQTVGELFYLFELSSALTAAMSGRDVFAPVPTPSQEAVLEHLHRM
jgi:glucose-6-phosphate isomerase